jgi:endonuclease YncB( thermonuclease family)
LDGQRVSLELDPSQGERDAFGRLLAYVWPPDGHNFGETMIAHCFAHEYTDDQPCAYLDSFKAAQDVAMASQAGLWSPSTCAGDTTRPAPSSTPAQDVAAPATAPSSPSSHVPHRCSTRPDTSARGTATTARTSRV